MQEKCEICFRVLSGGSKTTAIIFTTENTGAAQRITGNLLLPISAVYHPFDSFAQVEYVEVDQQADPDSA